MQPSTEVEPNSKPYLPTEHGKQDIDPTAEENRPGGQRLHEDSESAPEEFPKRPAEQDTHVALEVAPTTELKRPATQDSQLVSGKLLYFPAGQLAQTIGSNGLVDIFVYLPTSHNTQ